MSILSAFDTVCRKFTSWLVDHRFKQEVWSPLENSVQSKAVQQYERTVSALHSFDYGMQHPIMSTLDSCFTAYGAVINSAHVNKVEFNLDGYEGKSLVIKSQNYFNRSRERGQSLDMAQAFARALLAAGVDPVAGKWTRFYHTNAWLLSYMFFKHPDYVDFGKKYIKIMSYMCVLESMGLDIKEPTRIRDAENLLLNVLCSGFYMYSFNSYAMMLSFLPHDFKTRMPLVKLKMKRDGEYQYTPVEVRVCGS